MSADPDFREAQTFLLENQICFKVNVGGKVLTLLYELGIEALKFLFALFCIHVQAFPDPTTPAYKSNYLSTVKL